MQLPDALCPPKTSLSLSRCSTNAKLSCFLQTLLTSLQKYAKPNQGYPNCQSQSRSFFINLFVNILNDFGPIVR